MSKHVIKKTKTKQQTTQTIIQITKPYTNDNNHTKTRKTIDTFLKQKIQNHITNHKHQNQK